MRSAAESLDLKQSCRVYSESISRAMLNLMAVEVSVDPEIKVTHQMEDVEDLNFSIFFTGPVYGELLIGMNRRVALEMLGIEVPQGQEEKIYLQYK